MFTNLKNVFICSSALIVSLTVSIPVVAGEGTLSGVDNYLTTIGSKSQITGALVKDEDGYLAMDENYNFMFDYSGDVFRPKLLGNGELKAIGGEPIGTVSGQAAFPPQFAQLAFSVYEWLMNGGDPALMPPIPETIDWTMNDLTMVIDGTTYRPIPSEDMGLKARAFSGLGPVEIGGVLNGTDGLSMSIRMGGCFAVMAVSGRHEGKIGTECLNGTFTFDLSGIDLNNPMMSTLNGTGTSNCFHVMHQPLM